MTCANLTVSELYVIDNPRHADHGDAWMLGKSKDHGKLAAKEEAPPPIVEFMAAFETNDSVAIKGLSGVIGIMAAIETPDYVPQDPPPPGISGSMGTPQFVPPPKSEGKVRAAEEAIKYIWKENPPSKWVFSELERIRRLLEPHGYRFASDEALSKLARRASPKPKK